MKNPYIECPVFKTKNFTLRLVKEEDYVDLYACYHDYQAVENMNDDNCDFGFYVDSIEKMKETVSYWIKFYHDGYFIRFSVLNQNNKAIGTIEGFNGDTGVLRIDLASAYEKADILSELFSICQETFKELFGNKILVTKAKRNDIERTKALAKLHWKNIGKYKGYDDYYQIEL
ncbi:MAG: hypothetical protein WCS49_01210 [Bacilli bacterium]|nr:hypothetical protein [Bacilli bacterium]MDD3099072.1 hypothetical protein [Bacilli bacterium]